MPELFAPQVFLGVEVERMKTSGDMERGVVYTRSEVVGFILDLTGYTSDKPLWQKRLLEPSFGSGDFLLPALARLLEAAKSDGIPAKDLMEAVRAVELHRDTFEATKERVIELLRDAGVSQSDAIMLAGKWLINGDFLLEPFTARFDAVVGNPPYVRQEMIAAPMLAEYRKRYTTLYDRADLYVPFIEQSLRLLSKDGLLGFICSDRWMKNRYGGPLRQMISTGFTLKYYIDMVGTAAFQSEVIAYPAITVIGRGISGRCRIAHRPEVSVEALRGLHSRLAGSPKNFNGTVIEMPRIANGDDPWLLEADAQPSLSLVRRLEAEFPTLEEAGCSVGIGVATGADKVFIGPMDELDVEDERKLPLVMTRDMRQGVVEWRGLGVVNPFEEDGSLADFSRYPRFAAYMEKHGKTLKARHCAQKANGSWYRTIDRITPSLAQKPKLLIPDIKGDAHIVLEDGKLYPHHNLYFVLSKEWPLPALQAVLMAGLAHLFVRAYSTKMHGGALRFQAQYLRRIRLPKWTDIPTKTQKQLLAAVEAKDASAILNATAVIYGMTPDELTHLTPAT
ncbi:Eco57I restriction-modification methylase domain-containing protein [Prosthecobacter sp.]|uniref:Eco57I restriction-modification methylase domain-containing protein n=1 Tax=Prosthecobacter sp. TaxID=1965333 RepID=UPI002ABD0E2F|nr:Eco57I restriction-modification methylase domain-containing protein [Prosthecobacter sp.]MDZ4402533.1 Eco57I restriction-modification methylase domain-containing protein [Prosthecobacter sp.]